MADALVDTGVFLALLNRTDRWHAAAKKALRAPSGRLLTSWAVLTETVHMIGRPEASIALLEHVAQGAVDLPHLGVTEADAIAWYFRKYGDLKPDLADLSLLVLSDLTRATTILTFDSDFLIYRTRSGRALACPLLAKRS